MAQGSYDISITTKLVADGATYWWGSTFSGTYVVPISSRGEASSVSKTVSVNPSDYLTPHTVPDTSWDNHINVYQYSGPSTLKTDLTKYRTVAVTYSPQSSWNSITPTSANTTAVLSATDISLTTSAEAGTTSFTGSALATCNASVSDNHTSNYCSFPLSEAVAAITPRTGYHFDTWDGPVFGGQPKNATVRTYFDKGQYTYIYPNWIANTYAIRFNANTGSGSMSDSYYTYDESKALTANTFTKVGNTFAGWNTSADGSGTSYTDGQVVSNLSSTDGAIVILYAQWTPNTYTITFNANQGSGMMSPQSFTHGVAQALTSNTFTRENYTFTGWNTNQDGSGTSYTDGQSITVSSSFTLYAQWSGGLGKVYGKVNGQWKQGVIYGKVNGHWMQGEVYGKVNGHWKKGIN